MKTNLPTLPCPWRFPRGSARAGSAFVLNVRKHYSLTLPGELITESLTLDESSSSGLRWKFRPKHLFKDDHYWKIGNRISGKQAGTIANCSGKKYWRVGIGGRSFYGHRIVWFLANGFDPGHRLIDHKNLNGLDNSISNLRLASNSENMRNSGTRNKCTTGFKGVHFYKRTGKYVAHIGINNKSIYLGYFQSAIDAAKAYDSAARQHHGEFAKLNFVA